MNRAGVVVCWLFLAVALSGCVDFPERATVPAVSNDSSIQTITEDNNSAQAPSQAAPEPVKTVQDIPAQEPVDVPSSSVYNEADVESVVGVAKGLANEQQLQLNYFTKYIVLQGNTRLVVLTPYANTAMSLVRMIERYDEYTLADVRSLLNGNTVYTTAANIKTEELYSNWDKSALRAVIEIEPGKVCRGTINNVDTKMGDVDMENYQVSYLATISAAFDCYGGIYDKKVKVVYIVGTNKVVFDVDMRTLK